MFSNIRKIVFAAAAIAALGTATLITTTDTADARGGFSRGGGGGMRMGGGGGMRMHGGGGMRTGGMRGGGRVSMGRQGGGGRYYHPGRGSGTRWAGGHRRPHWGGHCRWGRCGIHVGYRWRRPWVYGAGVVSTGYAVAPTTYAVAPAVAAPAPRCTCLTKEYTQDGLVVFQDVCTKEVASAPIGNTQVQLPQQGQPQQQ
jgi:hypothetical protein